jgi:hypothetical protein
MLTQPLLLTEIDLATFREPVVDTTAVAVAEATGSMHCGVLFFEADLAPGIRVSTEPARADASTSWMSPVWVFPEAVPLERGQSVSFSYRYRVPGMTNGLRAALDGRS